jgi:pimeloyl-ACP methyl ester carboxylesterase
VLLLPGGAEAVRGFFPGLIEGLQADPGCRVILFDRPGTGESGDDGVLADAADALHTAISEAGLGPVVAIGQSLGAAVAVLLAAEHPADIAGLVLLDPTPVNDPKLADAVAKRARQAVALFRIPGVGALLRAMLRRGARASAERHDMTPEVRAAMETITDLDAAKLGRAVEGLGQVSRDLDLSTIPRVPAVVVTADRKEADPIRRAHAALAGALGAPLVSWPTAEHALHLTHPAEVLAESRVIVRAATSR